MARHLVNNYSVRLIKRAISEHEKENRIKKVISKSLIQLFLLIVSFYFGFSTSQYFDNLNLIRQKEILLDNVILEATLNATDSIYSIYSRDHKYKNEFLPCAYSSSIERLLGNLSLFEIEDSTLAVQFETLLILYSEGIKQFNTIVTERNTFAYDARNIMTIVYAYYENRIKNKGLKLVEFLENNRMVLAH